MGNDTVHIVNIVCICPCENDVFEGCVFRLWCGAFIGLKQVDAHAIECQHWRVCGFAVPAFVALRFFGGLCFGLCLHGAIGHCTRHDGCEH